METIYKGSGWNATVNFESDKTSVEAILYNRATKQSASLNVSGSGTTYSIAISGVETAKLGVGIYDLELYATDSIVDVKNNFAKVVETSKSN